MKINTNRVLSSPRVRKEPAIAVDSSPQPPQRKTTRARVLLCLPSTSKRRSHKHTDIHTHSHTHAPLHTHTQHTLSFSLPRAKMQAALDSLHQACIRGDIDSVRPLVDLLGKVALDSTSNGAPPLFLAAENGHLEIVRFVSVPLFVMVGLRVCQ